MNSIIELNNKISILQNENYLQHENIQSLSIRNEYLKSNLKSNVINSLNEFTFLYSLIQLKEKEGLIPTGFYDYIISELSIYRTSLDLEKTMNLS